MKNGDVTINLEKKQIYMYKRRKRKFKNLTAGKKSNQVQNVPI
jgi:hypothetical protein